MARLDFDAREITATIVVAGPPRAGKTSVLRCLHERVPPERRGALAPVGDGTASGALLDWLALELGRIGGWQVRVNCYAVPARRQAEATRRLLLTEADAVLFVADSQAERLPDNLAAHRQIEDGLLAGQRDVPFVYLYNKCDLPAELLLSAEALDEALGTEAASRFPCETLRGVGVMEAMHAAIATMMRRLMPGTEEA